MKTHGPTTAIVAALAALCSLLTTATLFAQDELANPVVAEHPPVKLGELFTMTTAGERAGASERLFSVRLAEPLPTGCEVQVVAVSDERGRQIVQALPSQSEPTAVEGLRRVWWIGPADRKSSSHPDAFRPERFRLERCEPSAEAKARSSEAVEAELRGRLAAGRVPLRIERSSDAVVVSRGESRIVRYNLGHVAPPAGVDVKYGRSAFIHPAWTPSGAIVTDQFPPDHLHQSGIFLAYTKTVFEGREPNFWDLLGGKGRVRFEAFQGSVDGPVFAEFRVDHLHVDLSSGEERPALRETWAVRVWNVGGPADGFWVWDLVSTIRCASASPLKLPQYHYGGMAVRGGRSWTKDAVRFLTSEKLGRENGNHSRPRWCDMSGPASTAADGAAPTITGHAGNTADTVGPADGGSATARTKTPDSGRAAIALLTHPGNFRFPEPLRIHPSMPYMVYTPSQLGDWAIEPEQTRTSRYRWLVHDGTLPTAVIDRAWQAFAR